MCLFPPLSALLAVPPSGLTFTPFALLALALQLSAGGGTVGAQGPSHPRYPDTPRARRISPVPGLAAIPPSSKEGLPSCPAGTVPGVGTDPARWLGSSYPAPCLCDVAGNGVCGRRRLVTVAQATEIRWDALTGLCCAAGSARCAGTGEQPEPGSSILPTFPCGGTTSQHPYFPPSSPCRSTWGFLIHFVCKFFRGIAQYLVLGPAMTSQCCQGRRIRAVTGALLS